MINLQNLSENFRRRYGTVARVFWAPGRVNLIGEHTDYNDGFVLPIALELGTAVAAREVPGQRVRVHSINLGESIQFDLDDRDQTETLADGIARRAQRTPPRWQSYVEGVARTLQAAGASLTGADLLVDSDVPPGSGLSSSAALELSVGLALLTIAGAHMTPVDLALACQQAEHQYAGVRCGIMDQFISALGRPGNALLIDCRSHEFSLVPIRMPDVDLVICDSGVTHSHAASEYNQRRAECEQGLSLLRRFSPDLKEGSALRDVTPLNLEQARESLPEVLYRRCRHVVSENVRTLEAAAALGSGDAESLGRLMCQSHRSLSEDYEVSCPELDLLVRMALEQPGVLGSRMTGGGFGGWTVNLVRKAEVENFKKVLTSRYEREMGHSPAILIVHASEGAREVIANRWSLH